MTADQTTDVARRLTELSVLT